MHQISESVSSKHGHVGSENAGIAKQAIGFRKNHYLQNGLAEICHKI